MINFKHKFKKKFGQNFLISDQWPRLMTEVLDIKLDDTIIEIGPGNGALTEQLVKSKAKIFSVEIDKELIPNLLNKFAQNENFSLIRQDILRLDIEKQGKKSYKVIGSLPYNISKKIINKFLLATNKPQSMLFIIQKEVGQDYTAIAPDNSALGLIAKIYADIKYIQTLKNTEFYPIPEVDGAIVLFENIRPKYEEPEQLAKFIKIGFLNARKKLSKTLESQGYSKELIEGYLKSEFVLSENARASELSIDQWAKLFEFCKELKKVK